MNKNNNNPLERVLLMMKYDMGKTLSENKEIVVTQFKTQLDEARPKLPSFTAGLGKDAARAEKAALVKQAKNTHANKPRGLNVREIQALKRDLLAKEVQIFANTPKGGKYPTKAEQEAFALKLKNSGKIEAQVNKITSGKVAQTKVPAQTQGKAGTSGVNQSNTQQQNITIKNVIGGETKAVRTASGKTKNLKKPKGNPPQGGKGGRGTITPSVGQKILKWVKSGWSFKKILKTLAILGITGYALYWFFWRNSDKVVVPDDIPVDPPAPDDTNITPTGNYTQCDETFPIRQYCKNNTIAKIQTCLGIVADGKFGPKTQAALEAKGLPGTEITEDTLNKACQSSGGDTGQKPKDASYYDDYQTDEVETTTSSTQNYDDYSPVEGGEETTTTTKATTTTQSTNSPTPNKKMFYPNPEEEYQ